MTDPARDRLYESLARLVDTVRAMPAYATGGTIPPAHAFTPDQIDAFISPGSPPSLDATPTDRPHAVWVLDHEHDARWHADEAERLAQLADLTAWCSDPGYAADLMWST